MKLNNNETKYKEYLSKIKKYDKKLYNKEKIYINNVK